MTENPNQRLSLLKQYLRTGLIEDQPPSAANWGDMSLNQLQAIFLRRQARMAEESGDTERAQTLRGESRLLNNRLSQVLDHEVVAHVMAAEQVDIGYVIQQLQQAGVEQLPVLSTTPQGLRQQLGEHFNLQIIPQSQVNITDFSRIVDGSEVPEEFSEGGADPEYVNILRLLRDRWFLILIVLLGLATAIGFDQNWSIEVSNVLQDIDVYFSLYGVTAITRSVWQLRRAREWNKRSRQETRAGYKTAFERMFQRYPVQDQTLLQRARELVAEKMNWEEFKEGFGLEEVQADEELDGLLDQYLQQYNAEQLQDGGDQITKQQLLAEFAQRRIEGEFGQEPPSVAFVIPTYKTSAEEMGRLLRSIRSQFYPVSEVFVVYNDDPNDPDPRRRAAKQQEFLQLEALVQQVSAEPGNNNCRITLLAQPARGKREAMMMGFTSALGEEFEQKMHEATSVANLHKLRGMRHDYVVNVDSDTEVADPFALLNSISLLEQHPRAAMTTGDVRVSNRSANLLTEMTYQRYWRAFNVERSAQALSGQVTCMSGPWVVMRSAALEGIVEDWYYQVYKGQRTTFGDDRHLSTLALREGWETLYCPDSIVLTDAPSIWEIFKRQQTRWSRSFNRENFILFSFLHKMDKFVQLDTVYQQTFQFAMLYILSSISVDAAVAAFEAGPEASWQILAPYLLTVFAYNQTFFGAYGALTNRDVRFFLSPVYIWYHFTTLLWLKLWAFATPNVTSWGTKGPEQDVIAQMDAIADETMAEMEAALAQVGVPAIQQELDESDLHEAEDIISRDGENM